MAIVYKHTRLDKNEVFYIGIGKTEKRAYSLENRNRYWKNISSKGYEVEILYTGLTWAEACNKEIELIKYYGRKDLGLGTLCNLTNGGEGTLGMIISEERKISSSLKQKGKKISDETKIKMSIANTGNKNGFYGKTHTVETRLKLSDAGKNISDETRNKMKVARIGKPSPTKGKIMSEEQKLKISIGNTGKKAYNKGKKMSEEQRLKLVEVWRIRKLNKAA